MLKWQNSPGGARHGTAVRSQALRGKLRQGFLYIQPGPGEARQCGVVRGLAMPGTARQGFIFQTE